MRKYVGLFLITASLVAAGPVKPISVKADAPIQYIASALPPVTGQPQAYEIYHLVSAVDASGAPVQVRQDDVKSITSAQLSGQATQLTAMQGRVAAFQAAIAALPAQ